MEITEEERNIMLQ